MRDNIHSLDVVRAFEEFAKNPRPGEVYNLGGGRANSVSMLEAIARIEALTGRRNQMDVLGAGSQGRSHLLHLQFGKIEEPLSWLERDAQSGIRSWKRWSPPSANTAKKRGVK